MRPPSKVQTPCGPKSLKSGFVAAAAFATCNDAGTLTGAMGSDLAAKRPGESLEYVAAFHGFIGLRVLRE
jgi:hypothetical protein